MKPKGIIFLGTQGAGIGDVADELIKLNSKYILCKGISAKGDIHKCCIVSKDKKGTVGYQKETLERLQNGNKIPIICVSAISYREMRGNDDNCFDEYLSFFIDAPDEVLNINLYGEQDKKFKMPKADAKERRLDRESSDLPNYIIQNTDSRKAADIIDRLVTLYGVGTVLSEKDIELYTANGLLVTDYDRKQIKGASYDLRLGDEYYYRGEIIELKKGNQRLTIAPYDYAIVASKETICLPKDVVAHFGLTVTLFCQGLILSNGQQVDPGFRGTLFCLLFNTSNQPVTIKRGDHYATIDFAKMDNFASKYKGKYQEKKEIIDVIPANAMQGGLSELKIEIEELKHESHSLQSIYISVISIIVAAISILLILK